MDKFLKVLGVLGRKKSKNRKEYAKKLGLDVDSFVSNLQEGKTSRNSENGKRVEKKQKPVSSTNISKGPETPKKEGKVEVMNTPIGKRNLFFEEEEEEEGDPSVSSVNSSGIQESSSIERPATPRGRARDGDVDRRGRVEFEKQKLEYEKKTRELQEALEGIREMKNERMKEAVKNEDGLQGRVDLLEKEYEREKEEAVGDEKVNLKDETIVLKVEEKELEEKEVEEKEDVEGEEVKRAKRKMMEYEERSKDTVSQISKVLEEFEKLDDDLLRDPDTLDEDLVSSYYAGEVGNDLSLDLKKNDGKEMEFSDENQLREKLRDLVPEKYYLFQSIQKESEDQMQAIGKVQKRMKDDELLFSDDSKDSSSFNDREIEEIVQNTNSLKSKFIEFVTVLDELEEKSAVYDEIVDYNSKIVKELSRRIEKNEHYNKIFLGDAKKYGLDIKEDDLSNFGRTFVEETKCAVCQKDFLDSANTAMHIYLNHPSELHELTTDQFKKLLDTLSEPGQAEKVIEKMNKWESETKNEKSLDLSLNLDLENFDLGKSKFEGMSFDKEKGKIEDEKKT